MSVSDFVRRAGDSYRQVPLPVRLCLWLILAFFGCVMVFAAFQKTLVYLPTREPWIEPSAAGLPPGRVHTITLQTEDGLVLRGWHILAEGQSAASAEECDEQLSNKPLVLFFSGNGGNRRYRVEEFGVLNRLGANVFLVDYRGYGDNPGSPSEQDLARDALRLWDYATRERGVEAERIVLYGESLGGGVAVRLASQLCQNGSPPAALILRSTFSSLVDVGSYHYPWLPVRMALTERYLSSDRISQVTCPILQFHGTDDTIVPLSFGQKLFAAAPPVSSQGIPKRFETLAGADHNDVLWVAARRV